jgi:HSP20 family protein
MFEYRSPFDRPSFHPFQLNQFFRGFDEAFREAERQSNLSIDSFGYAPAQLVEENERYVLTVEVPGVTEKDVHVDVQKGTLTVTAERLANVPEGYATRRRERSAVKFSRSYLFGEDRIDAEKTGAELKDGVLTVSIGKKPAAQKKAIAVKAT